MRTVEDVDVTMRCRGERCFPFSKRIGNGEALEKKEVSQLANFADASDWYGRHNL